MRKSYVRLAAPNDASERLAVSFIEESSVAAESQWPVARKAKSVDCSTNQWPLIRDH